MDHDHTSTEIRTQPALWPWATVRAREHATGLPGAGARVAAIGCGTSWFMAMAYAAKRESSGMGESDAFSPSVMPGPRNYDHLVVISRSGTTSELVRMMETEIPTTLITTVPDATLVRLADHVVPLERAAENSVVQTRSATCALMLLRASVGDPDVPRAIADASVALEVALPEIPDPVRQIVFLGAGWSVGIAYEAALKCREAAGIWAEAYPAAEFLHGPIAAVGPGSMVWSLEPLERRIADAVAGRGALLVEGRLDPLAELIRIQRLAHELACRAGRDPDHPDGLTFSVMVDEP